MAQLTRNDSTNVISSLQMDYGDSEEEDNSSRDVSRTEMSSSIKVVAAPPVMDLSEKETEVPLEPMETKEDASAPAGSEEIPSREMLPEQLESSQPNPDEAMESVGERISPVDFISDDDEGGEHHHRKHHRHLKKSDSEERKLAMAEAVGVDSPSSQGSNPTTRKATRLVSYGPDDDVDDSDSESEEEPEAKEVGANSPEDDLADPASLSRSMQNVPSDSVKIPPEPPGKCSAALQEKIISMYERMQKEGLDLNRVIQSKKNFRNPSIYEKLIDYCHIDEKGTNFPPEIYDPHIWGKESFYDELDKVQRKDHERREKEKKERTKIEFMTGTKKGSQSSSDVPGASEEKKRKTKWDAQPAPGSAPLKAPGVQGPGVVNLTATATGTKATIISAVGSLSKKPASSSSAK